MKKLFFVLIVFVAVWGSYDFYRSFIAEEPCVYIFGDGFHPIKDVVLKKNLRSAIELIKEYSPDDYERLCTYGKYIELRGSLQTLHSQVVRGEVHGGTYITKSYKTPDGVGLITINRAFGDDILYLSEVLTHEACHAYRIQTKNDPSEAPCYKRDGEHVARIPAELKRSLREPIQEYYVYCSDEAPANEKEKEIQGYCIFANNSPQTIELCADVFLGSKEERLGEKHMCALLEPLENTKQTFTLVGTEDYLPPPSYTPAITFSSPHAPATGDTTEAHIKEEEEASSIKQFFCKWIPGCGIF